MMRRLQWIVVLLASALAACADGPSWAPIDDQHARVGEELVIPLVADGVEVAFDVATDLPSGVSGRIDELDEGRARFHWTPLVSDVGRWALLFAASDAHGTSLQTVAVEVSGDDLGAPRFVQPLGSGTTLDTLRHSCLDLPVVVEDGDSPQVMLDEREGIEGASFEQTGPLAGRWTFCPTIAQVLTDGRYRLTLAADDGEHVTTKDYLVVLRQGDETTDPAPEPKIDWADLCVTCSSDSDCGGVGDLCVSIDEGNHCLAGCSGSDDCPAGYLCSFTPMTSIDGASARQCLPTDYQCDSA